MFAISNKKNIFYPSPSYNLYKMNVVLSHHRFFTMPYECGNWKLRRRNTLINRFSFIILLHSHTRSRFGVCMFYCFIQTKDNKSYFNNKFVLTKWIIFSLVRAQQVVHNITFYQPQRSGVVCVIAHHAI